MFSPYIQYRKLDRKVLGPLLFLSFMADFDKYDYLLTHLSPTDPSNELKKGKSLSKICPRRYLLKLLVHYLLIVELPLKEMEGACTWCALNLDVVYPGAGYARYRIY
jgi:hypothetical protein